MFIKLPSRSSAGDEYGDFQTPVDLAERVCSLASRCLPEPATVIEPTCGTGTFLIAALDRFAGVERTIGA
jgi:type I restriction-modification system DNA methylase subunit